MTTERPSYTPTKRSPKEDAEAKLARALMLYEVAADALRIHAEMHAEIFAQRADIDKMLAKRMEALTSAAKAIAPDEPGLKPLMRGERFVVSSSSRMSRRINVEGLLRLAPDLSQWPGLLSVSLKEFDAMVKDGGLNEDELELIVEYGDTQHRVTVKEAK